MKNSFEIRLICFPFQTKLMKDLIYKKLFRRDRRKCQYDNNSLIRNFNLTVENKNFDVFMNFFDLQQSIKNPNCSGLKIQYAFTLFQHITKKISQKLQTFEGLNFPITSFTAIALSQLMKGYTDTKLHHAYRYFHMESFIQAVLDANVECNNIFCIRMFSPLSKIL